MVYSPGMNSPDAGISKAQVKPANPTKKAAALQSFSLKYDTDPSLREEEQYGEMDHCTQDIQEVAIDLQKLSKNGKGPDAWYRNFAQKIGKDKDDALKELNDLSKNLDASTKSFEGNFRDLLSTALAPVSNDANVAKPGEKLLVSHVTAAKQPLYQQSVLLVAESKSLLNEYYKLAAVDNEPLQVQNRVYELKMDEERLEQVLRAGKSFISMHVKALLADKYHQVRGRSGMPENDQYLAMELLRYAEVDDNGLGEVHGWGNVALKAKRAAEKMRDVSKMEN